MQDATINLNQNATQCLKTVQSIGHETVMNICNSTSTLIPWGSLDWLAFLVVGAGVLAIVLMLFAIVFHLIFDF